MGNDKPLTIQEFARLGGNARAQKLSKEERTRSAKKAADARWARLKKTMDKVESDLNELKKSTAAAKRRTAANRKKVGKLLKPSSSQ